MKIILLLRSVENPTRTRILRLTRLALNGIKDKDGETKKCKIENMHFNTFRKKSQINFYHNNYHKPYSYFYNDKYSVL